MDQIFTCILLLLSLSGTFSKYVYIKDRMDRHEAQTYCQQKYTDLAPVSNERDNLKLGKLGNVSEYIWIGLERNSSDREKWMWSGGGAVSEVFWADTEPNDMESNEDYGFMLQNMWYDVGSHYEKTFFCYRAIVVSEKKTWEEALEYCREHCDDLASVASETEMLLIQRELKKQDMSEYVWIGLHFFSGYWLWVDGQELSYEAWGQEGKPLCPHSKMECAALQDIGQNKSVWVAHDCEEKFNFICY